MLEEEWRPSKLQHCGDTNGSSNLGQTTKFVIVSKKREDMPHRGFCRPCEPQSENQRKRKGKISTMILPEN